MQTKAILAVSGLATLLCFSQAAFAQAQQPQAHANQSAAPSPLPAPQANTAAAAGAFGAGLATGLAAGLVETALAGLFVSVFRAETAGAGLPRTGADGFDFAGIFFDLATALAMAL